MSVDFLSRLDSIADQIGDALGIEPTLTGPAATGRGYTPRHRADVSPIGNDFDGVLQVMKEAGERGKAKTARLAETRVFTDEDRAKRDRIIAAGRALEERRRNDVAVYFLHLRKP